MSSTDPAAIREDIRKRTGIELPFDPNPIQVAGWDVLPEHEENIVVATQASTGKTFFLELAMALGGGGVYVTPTKALCEQKFDDWTRPGHPFGESIVVKTGDHPTDNAKLLGRRKYRLMTPEAFGSATRNLNTNLWLRDLRVLALDEIHHFGSEGRGHKLEAALVDFFSTFQNCRVIAASATLPNAKEIGTWLTRLNGRETYVIESPWRPQPLYKHFVPFTFLLGSGAYFVNEMELVHTAAQIALSKPDEKFILFVHTKNAGWKLKKALEEDGVHSEFHNADLNLQKRKDLEERFTHGDLRVLIATSTVAAGCNFPARNVVVCGVYRGKSDVDARDLIQMGERAGRPGFDPKGDAYYLLPSHAVDQWKERLAAPPPIESKINEISNLAFHLIAGIAKGRVTNEAELEAWFSKTFAFHAGEPVTEAKHIIDRLLKARAVVVEDGKWEATALGRAAANFYYDPFDIFSWHANFMRLKSVGLTNPKKVPDIVLAWAIGNAPSGATDYVAKDCQPLVGSTQDRLEHVSMQLGLGLVSLNTGVGITAAYSALQNPEEFPDDDLPGGIRFAMFNLQNDAERIAAVMLYVDSATKLGMRDVIEETLLRIKYRVPPEAVEVCKIKYVGRARALVLLQHGIKDAKGVVDGAEMVVKLFGEFGSRIVDDAERIAAKQGYSNPKFATHQWAKKSKEKADKAAPKKKSPKKAAKTGRKKGVGPKSCGKKKAVKKRAKPRKKRTP